MNLEQFELKVLRGKTVHEDWFCNTISSDIGLFLDIKKIFAEDKKNAFKELCKKKCPQKFYFLPKEKQKEELANLLDLMGIDFLLWVDGDLVAIDLTSSQDKKMGRQKLCKMEEALPLVRAIGEKVGAKYCYGAVVQWIIFSRQGNEKIKDWMLAQSFCHQAVEEFSAKLKVKMAGLSPCFKIKVSSFTQIYYEEEVA
jgi:hypothetical protein